MYLHACKDPQYCEACVSRLHLIIGHVNGQLEDAQTDLAASELARRLVAAEHAQDHEDLEKVSQQLAEQKAGMSEIICSILEQQREALQRKNDFIDQVIASCNRNADSVEIVVGQREDATDLLRQLFDYVMIQEGGFTDEGLANEVATFLPPVEEEDGEKCVGACVGTCPAKDPCASCLESEKNWMEAD